MVGMFEFWWHHGLIADETLDTGLKVCPGSSFIHVAPECRKIWDKALKEQGNIDGYSIYTPPCDKGSPYARRLRQSRHVSCIAIHSSPPGHERLALASSISFSSIREM
jgi:hydroxymandelonitrile lyase/serine carboxypeptidase-like clade 2